jgi:hypothetical protein
MELNINQSPNINDTSMTWKHFICHAKKAEGGGLLEAKLLARIKGLGVDALQKHNRIALR